MEEITAGQAMNLAQKEPGLSAPRRQRTVPFRRYGKGPSRTLVLWHAGGFPAVQSTPDSQTAERWRKQAPDESDSSRFQVEVAPLQAVVIDDGRVFIFRRIGIGGQIYRQGFVLRTASPLSTICWPCTTIRSPLPATRALTLNCDRPQRLPQSVPGQISASRPGIGLPAEPFPPRSVFSRPKCAWCRCRRRRPGRR